MLASGPGGPKNRQRPSAGGPKSKAAKQKPPPNALPKRKEQLEDDKHLFYDEVEVAVRSGGGGHGAVISLPKRGDGPRLKRTADDDFELPPGGGHGGDVILVVDPSVNDLLHLRGKPVIAAARGGDSLGLRDLPAARQRWRELADAEVPDLPAAASGVRLRDAEPLRIGVPPGTFVRTKSGRVLGDLVRPGEELCVAVGGEGGPCVLNEDKQKRIGGKAGGGRRANDPDAEAEDAFALSEDELYELTRGKSSAEARLSLIVMPAPPTRDSHLCCVPTCPGSHSAGGLAVPVRLLSLF